MVKLVIYTSIITMLPFYTFAQNTNLSEPNSKATTTLKDSKSLNNKNQNSTQTIISYYVEERTNNRFGGYVITYEVSDLKLINTNNLGPNNTRTITPRYKENNRISNRQKASPINTISTVSTLNKNENKPLNQSDISIEQNSIKIENKAITNETIKPTPLSDEKKVEESSNNEGKHIYINKIHTYERMALKGVKTVENLKKIGDYYFFDTNYSKAVKWYTELFKITDDLEANYFYRFAIALKAIGENNKSEIFMKKFSTLDSNKTTK